MKNLLNKLINTPGLLKKKETETLLKELREEVNELDKEIAQKLLSRIKLSLYIARAKRLLKIPSYSPEREKNILQNVLSGSSDELSRKVLKSIYERIIDESRGIQKLRHGDEQE